MYNNMLAFNICSVSRLLKIFFINNTIVVLKNMPALKKQIHSLYFLSR